MVSIYKFKKSTYRKTYFSDGSKSNYIYGCTVKPDEITTDKKVMVNYLHRIKVYTISSLVNLSKRTA